MHYNYLFILRNLFISLLIFFVIIGLSCNNRKDITKKFIPEEKMVYILVDMYISDGVMSSTLIRKNQFIKDTISNYQHIFQKYEFNRNEFDSAIAILTDNPEEFALIYEDVIARLTEVEGNLTDTIKQKSKQKTF